MECTESDIENTSEDNNWKFELLHKHVQHVSLLIAWDVIVIRLFGRLKQLLQQAFVENFHSLLALPSRYSPV